MLASLRFVTRLSLALTVLGALPLAAQGRVGAVSGVVKDSLGNPIRDVEVTALRAAKSVRTDSVGHFILGALPYGPTDIGFRRLSFEPVILIITIPPSDTTDVQVTLGVAAQKLTGMVIEEHPDQLRQLIAFENRRRQGIGHFITREQIEKRNPLLLSDMIRTVPGTILIPDAGRIVLRFSRSARNGCPPQFFIDGIQATGFNIDDMPARDVEGVELYAGSVGLPPEYNQVHGTSICGTVIIWTRIPSTSKTKSP
jgi:hypothetical protein